jgi:hypothetical protein
MWTRSMERKTHRRRRDLLISSATQGKATGKLGQGASSLSERQTPGRIVIHGWSGERSVSPAGSRTPGVR